ncbi:phosphatidate cytidylyltransferase [Acuticoccus sp. I52.16.1]|uniref:phosphatidate cytidylyltransferase n=1 Tax=Acuticoccus sp. I52.16.1 TaxID=2928472 RepID=UPI001FD17664|nr:phosphatidate cytidylyltransferase [Acuticoccus sp. I52.16.1]UOM34813.1 phosphatidate cytidylyltransferase [Acuticoccus sp. I52.16.1]
MAPPPPPPPPPSIRARARRLRQRFVFQREMRLRLISAAILIPVVIFALWVGEIAFAGIVLVTALLVQEEWLRMVGAGHLRRVVLAAFAVLGILTVVAVTQPLWAAAAVLAAGCLGVGATVLLSTRAASPWWVAAGVLYAGLAVIALVELRKGGDGFGAVVFVFLIAWTTDTAAFFVGRKVGGPRLWRSVSPSKTWSGAIGGVLAGALCGAFVLSLLEAPPSALGFAVAALVAVASVGGDLLESAAKRRFHIKDAGTLIPGHGGVMDRVDGLITASVVTMLIGSLAAAHTPAAGLLLLMGRP